MNAGTTGARVLMARTARARGGRGQATEKRHERAAGRPASWSSRMPMHSPREGLADALHGVALREWRGDRSAPRARAIRVSR